MSIRNKWIDGWKEGRKDGWMDGWMEGWKDGWKEEKKDGWMNGRMGMRESPVVIKRFNFSPDNPTNQTCTCARQVSPQVVSKSTHLVNRKRIKTFSKEDVITLHACD